MDDAFPMLQGIRKLWKTAWTLMSMTALCIASAISYAQSTDVTLHVDIVPDAHARHTSSSASRTVVWLIPLDAEATVTPSSHAHTYQMVQENKRFDPHLLVVPVGSIVQFPNRDPFFHNVFSLFNGKRFDLGLYEAGGERGVRFDREGVSYIFCNIHPEMGAVILALSTPYYAVSSAEGVVAIPHVPDGKYMLNTWSEGAVAESMSAARRQIVVPSEAGGYGTISLTAAPSPLARHANKFGKSYPPAAGSTTPDSPY